MNLLKECQQPSKATGVTQVKRSSIKDYNFERLPQRVQVPLTGLVEKGAYPNRTHKTITSSKIGFQTIFTSSTEKITLLSQQNVFLIKPEIIRIVVVTIMSTVTTTISILTTIVTAVAVTSNILTTTILVC